MSYSTFFFVTYLSLIIIYAIIQIKLIYYTKKSFKRTLMIYLVLVVFVAIGLNSNKIFGITHRFFLLNSPFQKDLLEITEWNGKEYILVDIKKGKIELMEVEVNRKEKSVKLFKNTLVEKDFKVLTLEGFKTKKVELMKWKEKSKWTN
mgnify:CR=1 FL=1